MTFLGPRVLWADAITTEPVFLPILLQIAVGGAIGAVLRYGAVRLSVGAFGANFPWGTFAVNVVGCFAMGAVFVFAQVRDGAATHPFAPFLMTGVLGGFTTFSAFSLEVFQLAERGRGVAALAYAGGSVVLCLIAVAAGIWAARAASLP